MDSLLCVAIGVGLLFLVPVLIGVGIYNSLVRLRTMVRESWSDIDTELKRRYNLVPNLVETVKGYAKHEKSLLEAVARARAAAASDNGTVAHQSDTEQRFQDTLKTLFAVVENYPQLKSDHAFLSLQKELANTENRIQASRRFYNGNVRDLNIRCQTFPASMVASLFSFETAQFFRLRLESERQMPNLEWE